MKRKALSAAIALAVGAVAAATWHQTVRQRNTPIDATVRQLAADGENGSRVGRTVTVSLPHRPEPTADPLVWHFRDAAGPATHLPIDLEIRLAQPHRFDGNPPHRVTGTAAFTRDGRRRPNGQPGYVTVTDAIPSPAP